MTKPALLPPKVLFLFSVNKGDANTAFGGFVKRLQKQGALKGVEADYMALEDLIFEIKGKRAKIYNAESGVDLNEYSLVYFKSWQSLSEQAVAAATYLEAHGIPYLDPIVGLRGGNKLATHFKLWKDNLPVIATRAATAKHIAQVASNSGITYPQVVKATSGQKGQLNFLVKSSKELLAAVRNNPNVLFLIQDFIPNDGDYRIGVYGSKARIAIYRQSGGDSHLNNISAGANADLVELNTLPERIVNDATAAADTIGLAIAGVDVMVNKKTGKHYILEVNQGSQIVTGSFTEAKMNAFGKFIRQAANRRYVRATTLAKRPVLIGRHVRVDLPELGIESLPAKVDTGAYRPSIHAEDIKVVKHQGIDVLRFQVPIKIPGHPVKEYKGEAATFRFVKVRNTSGVYQTRYTITTPIVINGVRYKTEMTLSNRGSMKYPLLIGRRLLRGHFLVNVELSGKDVL